MYAPALLTHSFQRSLLVLVLDYSKNQDQPFFLLTLQSALPSLLRQRDPLKSDSRFSSAANSCFISVKSISSPHRERQTYPFAPQQFLYFLPLPQIQGSLRPISSPLRIGLFFGFFCGSPLAEGCTAFPSATSWRCKFC